MKQDPQGWHGCPLEEHHPSWPYWLALILMAWLMTAVPNEEAGSIADLKQQNKLEYGK